MTESMQTKQGPDKCAITQPSGRPTNALEGPSRSMQALSNFLSSRLLDGHKFTNVTHHGATASSEDPIGLATSPTAIRSLLPSIGITKHRMKQIEAIQLVREQRQAGNQRLAYHARPFLLCGIPVRRPPSSQAIHLRRNGKFFLQIISHPTFGLPYGQDRLIPIWIATLAIRQKSRVIRFQCAAEMLDFFKLAKDGRHYRRIMQGFQRIFAATIFFGTEEHLGGKCLIDWARFHFLDRMQLWFAEGSPAQDCHSDKASNVITLSEAFYNEIEQHRIPVEREVVAMLANAPGVLDFYLWIVWKTWALNGQASRVPILASGGLADQLGTKPYAVSRTFRHVLTRWLQIVRTLWPECTAVISADGAFLIVRSSRQSPAITSVQKPVGFHPRST